MCPIFVVHFAHDNQMILQAREEKYNITRYPTENSTIDRYNPMKSLYSSTLGLTFKVKRSHFLADTQGALEMSSDRQEESNR